MSKKYNSESQRKWREKNPNYNKEWRKANPDKKYNERAYAYARRNRHKKSARDKVYYAVKHGKLIRPTECSKCGNSGSIQADHHDYTKPLEVTWLCRECHQQVTMARKQ